MLLTPDNHPAFVISADPPAGYDESVGLVLRLDIGLYSSIEKAQEAAETLAMLVNLTIQKEAAGPLN
jgi:hypothetical protein